MTPGLEYLLIAWAVVTVLFIMLLFYRIMLTRQEDDQHFIDDSASAMAAHQRELLSKANKLTPVIATVGAASGVMPLVIAGWAFYVIGLNSA